jgi:hypothetical protein
MKHLYLVKQQGYAYSQETNRMQLYKHEGSWYIGRFCEDIPTTDM